MCLNRLLPIKEQQRILDKIDKKGLKVYKVVWVNGEGHFPAYKTRANKNSKEFNGTMEATQVKLLCSNAMDEYFSGFHFFKTKAAANRLRNNVGKGHHKVIECHVKKSWITEIGTESGRKSGDGDGWYRLDINKQETVIVAKKAIFPKFSGE